MNEHWLTLLALNGGLYLAGLLAPCLRFPLRALLEVSPKSSALHRLLSVPRLLLDRDAASGFRSSFFLLFLAGTSGMFLALCPWEPMAGALPSMGIPIAMTWHLDALSRLFVGLISSFGILTAFFSPAYLRGIAHRRCLAPGDLYYVPLSFGVFLLAMTQVVLADNVFLFLLAWELMTLSSALFIWFHHQVWRQQGGKDADKEHKETRAAFVSYLLTGQLSTAALAAGFLLVVLSRTGVGGVGWNLSGLAASVDLLPSVNRWAAFLLLFVGFASKAAIVPFHSWLHFLNASSPGNAHALHSSLMVKIGIYGLIRLMLEILPPDPVLGSILLVTAGITALVGVQYAIAEHDLKRILACHTVENMGIILAGAVLASLLRSTGHDRAAALALTGCLLHVLNHAAFKGLLLYAMAAIDMEVGSVRLDALGRLFPRMKWVSAMFLVGAAAISGLPGLNGFVSEWITLQSLVRATTLFGASESPSLLIGLVITFTLLAMALAATALCFVKICGMIFFGDERKGPICQIEDETPSSTPHVAGTTGWMKSVLGILAAGCVIAGLLPGLAMSLVGPAVSDLVGVTLPSPWRAVGLSARGAALAAIPRPEGDPGAQIVPALAGLLVLLICTGLAVWTRKPHGSIVRQGPESRSPVRQPTWTGGNPPGFPSSQANANQLSSLYLDSAILTRQIQESTETPLLDHVADLGNGKIIREHFRYFYGLAAFHLERLSGIVGDKIQNGDLQRYLLYLIAALVTIFALFWGWS